MKKDKPLDKTLFAKYFKKYFWLIFLVWYIINFVIHYSLFCLGYKIENDANEIAFNVRNEIITESLLFAAINQSLLIYFRFFAKKNKDI